MSFAGHMTLRMQQHYTTISLVSKRKWARSTWQEEPLELVKRSA